MATSPDTRFATTLEFAEALSAPASGGIIGKLKETIAEPRFFPGLLKPVGLMAADFPAMREKVFERYPMMRSTAFERRMLFERRDERHSSLDVVAPLERTSIVPNS